MSNLIRIPNEFAYVISVLVALVIIWSSSLFIGVANAAEPVCEKVMVDPSPTHAATKPLDYPTAFAAVWFSESVSSGQEQADGIANLSHVYLVDPAGHRVKGAHSFSSGAGGRDNYIIYIVTDEWLAPLTEYRICIEPGIVSLADGTPSTKRYEFALTTGDDLPISIGLYQLIAMIMTVCALIVGGIVAAIRKKVAR